MIHEHDQQPRPVKTASWQRNVAEVVKVVIYTIVPKNNVKS